MIRRSLLRPRCSYRTTFRLLPFSNKRCFELKQIYEGHDERTENNKDDRKALQQQHRQPLDAGLAEYLESVRQRIRKLESRFVTIKDHRTMQLHCDVPGHSRAVCEMKLDDEHDVSHPIELRMSFIMSPDKHMAFKAAFNRGTWVTSRDGQYLAAADRELFQPIAEQLLSEIQGQSPLQLAGKIARLDELQRQAEKVQSVMWHQRHLQYALKYGVPIPSFGCV